MDYTRPKATEQEAMYKVLRTMERMLRLIDQLDETIHTNGHFYVPTATNKYASVTEIVKPMVMVLVGFVIPMFLDYLDK